MPKPAEQPPSNVGRPFGPGLVAGLRRGLRRGIGGHGADPRRHRPDLGRALVPDQPARLGPLVGGADPGPEPGPTSTPCSPPRPCSTTGPMPGSGYNFHPPLAGQLNLLTHAIFGGFMKDIPSRRMASVIEYSATIALLFGFLARRYGAWVGGVAAGALAGDAAGLRRRPHRRDRHAGAPALGRHRSGVLEGPARAGRPEVAGPGRRRAGPGVRREDGGRRRARAAPALDDRRPAAEDVLPQGGRSDWIDGVVTSSAMLLPLGLAFREVLRLARVFPPPKEVNLFTMHPPTAIPGVILLLPWSSGSSGGWSGWSFRGTRSGARSVRRWRPGRRSWRSRRWSAGWATPPGGARPCRGWPTITSSAPTAGGPCPTSGSCTSARSTRTASPGTTPGS